MIYLDHHSTTPLDPAALESMLPLLGDLYANAGSITHTAGRQVGQLVDESVERIGNLLGASSDEIVVTSGATESNNLAVLGACLHPRQKRRKVVSVATEHNALLGPLQRLKKQGFTVQLLPVLDHRSEAAGQVDLDNLEKAVDGETALVSIMLANNEIGTIQPIAQIAEMCHRRGALFHTDASQAVGRLPVDVDRLGVDLLSFSAHKFYGPKGIGGLFVRRRERRVRLQPQIVGGGQQHNLRSGTLNAPGIVGMARALEVCLEHRTEDALRIASLRNRLFERLQAALDFVELNGPTLSNPSWRLPGNLNCTFYPLEGQSLMQATPELAVSSGSACTSAEPSPSHVLLALGLSEDQARSSLRFGVGRFNTEADIDLASEWLAEAAGKLSSFL